MLKLNGLHTRLPRNVVVATILLALSVGILAVAFFLPVKAALPTQKQEVTPTPGSMMDGSMMDGGMMGSAMSMADMGAMMDQMMAHMYGMMGTMPMSGTMPMAGMMAMADTMPMCGMMPMAGTMPMTDTMPMAGMMHMHENMPMTSTMPMSGTMSMAEMGMMMQMMGLMQMHMGCMHMMMGSMMSGGMMQEGMMPGGMMGSDTMGSDTMGNGMMGSGADMPSGVPFDAMFIDSMIEHHEGAIDMALEVLKQAEHEELFTLAEGIIVAQTAEIEQMHTWRSEWYPDLPPTGGMQMSMGDMTISDDESVPFDERFLDAMISHHQGAIDMAKMALEEAEHEEIHTLAENIITAQEAEIEHMQGWHEEWHGAHH